jgi:hypothetical protein
MRLPFAIKLPLQRWFENLGRFCHEPWKILERTLEGSRMILERLSRGF